MSAFHIRQRRPLTGSPSGSVGPVTRCRCTWASGTHSGVLDRLEVARLGDPARRLEVVEDRLVAREALVAHHLLDQQPAVVAELGVALAGDVPEPVVPHRLPLLSCSRSIASNSALKLPSPKPRAPWRSITSRNTVGRSPIVCVKICSR